LIEKSAGNIQLKNFRRHSCQNAVGELEGVPIRDVGNDHEETFAPVTYRMKKYQA
jgi:hypothetical protein